VGFVGERAVSLSRRSLWWAGLGLGTLSALAGIYYSNLSHRSTWLATSSVAEALDPPRPNFRIGSLFWDVASYADEPRLEPFRKAFAESCGSRRGLRAALCVSNTLARQFPHGTPPAEFIDRDFDPVAHLLRHIGGAPGHCMNRSAILASELLVAGIAARVVQILPKTGPGHTIVEVWDDEAGWVAVDPTYGAVLGNGAGPSSAVGLTQSPQAARWFALLRAPAPTSLVEATRRNGPDRRLFDGQILYPEPWLYLRVGRKDAPWPFRGTFECIANGLRECGGRHMAVRLVFVASALGSIACIVAGVRKQSTERR
jgi:hypothetical protein